MTGVCWLLSRGNDWGPSVLVSKGKLPCGNMLDLDWERNLKLDSLPHSRPFHFDLRIAIPIAFAVESYTRGVQRLLQFGSFVLIVVAIAAPISAFFDRWDPPSLGDDTEMTVFALVLVLCLLLLVCRLIASFVAPLTRLCRRELDWDEVASMWNRVANTILFVPPQSPSPLRI